MEFLEAIDFLKQGSQIRRTSWKKEDGYLTLMPGMSHVWKILLVPNPNAGNHIFSVEEICANDYMIHDGYAEPCTLEHGYRIDHSALLECN